MAGMGAMFCPLCSIALSFWGDERENGLDCHNCELTWHEDEDGHLYRCTCFSDGSVPLELAKPGLGVPVEGVIERGEHGRATGHGARAAGEDR